MKESKTSKRVNVTSVGFRKNLAAYPRQMEMDGVTINFIDAGLRCLVKRGGRIAEILTLSDGKVNFCLRTLDCGNHWTLLNVV